MIDSKSVTKIPRSLCSVLTYWRYTVADLVKAPRYQPEGRGSDSRWCHWHIPSSHCGPGVDSACNRNEYQEYFIGGKGGRCIGLTTLLSLGAHCLEIWEPQLPGTFRACPELYKDCLTNVLGITFLESVYEFKNAETVMRPAHLKYIF